MYQEISEILGEVAQRSCGISILGDFKIRLDKAFSDSNKVTGADEPQELPPSIRQHMALEEIKFFENTPLNCRYVSTLFMTISALAPHFIGMLFPKITTCISHLKFQAASPSVAFK